MKKFLNRTMAMFLATGMILNVGTEVIFANNSEFQTISFEEGEDHYDMKITNNIGKEGVVTVNYSNESVTAGDRSLDAQFTDGTYAAFSFTPKDGNLWDFSDTGKIMAFDLDNPTPDTERLFVGFLDNSGNTRFFRITMSPYTNTTAYAVIDDAQRGYGMMTLPPVDGNHTTVLQDAWQSGATFNYDSVKEVVFRLSDAGNIIFDNIRMINNPYDNFSESLANTVDTYGQYAKDDWEGKIKSDEDLLAAAAAEDAKLLEMAAENAARDDRTIYGGWKNDDYKQEATGKFYATKIGNQWTLIDPLGYPYFSTGLGIVRIDDSKTWVTGREFMFEDIPSKDSYLGDHYGVGQWTPGMPDGVEAPADVFRFYSANLERKYGDEWEAMRADKAVERFKAWGMTSIACWSEKYLFYGQGEKYQIPYVVHTVADAWPNATTVNLNSSVPDPFDPTFEENFRLNLEFHVTKYNPQNDPFCMGVYVDNEFPWNGTAAFALNTDATAETSYAKKYIVDLLKQKYATIEDLNAAWETSHADWSVIEGKYTGKVSTEDSDMILNAIANKYYKTIHDVVEQEMPDTLYLGSRNTEWGTPIGVIQAAIEYVDILSFNCYQNEPIREKFLFEEYDLPMIIGEFNFTSTQGNGTFGIHERPVNSLEERGDYYQGYIEAALKNGNYVGAHWFQYYDQPISGRAWDGENSGAGFVDVTDQPYDELIDSAREIHQNMYELKFSYVATEKIDILHPEIYLDNAGDQAVLEFVTSPSIVDKADLVFVSSNLGVAEISENGIITANGPGVATITARSRYDLTVISTCTVNVAGAASPNTFSLAFNADITDSVPVGTNVLSLGDKFTAYPLNSSNDIAWKSSENSIATVDEFGNVTAHSAGEVNILVYDKNGNARDSIHLTVN